MYTKASALTAVFAVRIIATILLILAITVVLAWHDAQRTTPAFMLLRAIAYSTAQGFLLVAVALLAMSWRLLVIMRVAGVVLFFLAALTLADIFWLPDLAINRQLMWLVSDVPPAPVPMALTTAISFALIAIAFLLLSASAPRATSMIVALFFHVVVVTIAIIALSVHLIGQLPAFEWLGVKMAIPTALAFILVTIALLIYGCPSLVAAFKQLNFFGHMVVAFGFMALVFISTGSVVLAQVDNLAAVLNQSDVDLHSDARADAKRLIVISLVGFLSLGLLVAYLITHRLSNQLQQLRQAMLDIAHKREGVKIPFLNNMQEVGDMARALAVFAANIQATWRMEERMRQIIEAAPNGIVMVNEVGVMEIVNRQAEHIFGYDRAELLGQPVEKLIPAPSVNHHPQHRADFFSRPAPRAMGAGRDLFGLRKDGKEFPVEIGLAPITTDEGIKVLASIVDITERKKSAQLLLAHQRDLEKSNRELVRINKELETFAYVASHDLKSPLRGIAQLSNWIDEDLQAKEYEGVAGHTTLLRSRILRMEKLLDDLLAFYRAGKIDTNQRLVDVKRMAMDLFEMQNLKPGLRLTVEASLPVFVTPAVAFEQVLRNLFSNAIKHHDNDEGVIRLTYRELKNDYFEFSVWDDGPGIPEQYQQRIFGMFQTLKPRDELEGSGMGLALIKKIVENYNGEIRVHSVGRGTCFTFTWPKQWRTPDV